MEDVRSAGLMSGGTKGTEPEDAPGSKGKKSKGGGHRFWRLVAAAYPPLRLSGVVFCLLSEVFGKMPVFFVGELF